MSEFKLTIDCDNDAFIDNPGLELSMILTRLAKRLEAGPLEQGVDGGKLFDSNGNSVGEWSYE